MAISKGKVAPVAVKPGSTEKTQPTGKNDREIPDPPPPPDGEQKTPEDAHKNQTS